MLSSIIGSVTIVADPITGCQTNERRINMLFSDVDAIAKAASNKAELCNNHFGKYFMRSIMAGFYIVVATILSNVSAAVLLPTYPQFGKLLGAFLFSIAIVLVVFMGGELFTGNNMVMTEGSLNKGISSKDMCKVWIYSYIGNLLGSILVAVLFVGSGLVSQGPVMEFFATTSIVKSSDPFMQRIFRGILCNILVCVAVLCSFRTSDDSAKLIMIFYIYLHL